MPSRHFRLLFSASQNSALHSPPKNHLRRTLIFSIVGAFISFAVAVLLLLFLHWYRKILRQRSNNKTSPEDGAAFKLRKFKYRQLKRATKSFSQSLKLGKGGFGVVYRGVLKNGKEVAVKKLDLRSLQGEREFQNELSICGGLDSLYVVRLLGYCTHGRRVRLLVYECMQNRSLQEALFEKGYPVHLDWGKRWKIIMDTAKGLEFLHVQCNPCIIHGDVKPSNILLDVEFNARIADFGLARLKSDDSCSDSARVSSSTDRFRPETPDIFRFGTPDRLSSGTPEMSRSSTTKNAPVDTTTRVVAEHPVERKKLFEDVTIDVCGLVPSEKDAKLANGNICSPSNHAAKLHDFVSEAENQSLCRSTDGFDANIRRDTPDDGDKNHLSEVDPAHPDDLQLLSLNRQLSRKKMSRNDWWWRQDTGAESAGKDYVLDWLGSELVANGQNGNSKDGEIIAIRESGVAKEQQDKAIIDANTDMNKSLAGTEVVKKERKKTKSKHRKSREWWKDEYFVELSSKGRQTQHTRGRKLSTSTDVWKDYSGELGNCSGELRKVNYRPSKNGHSRDCLQSSYSVDLCPYQRKERRLRFPSIASDGWSGDFLNRQASGDLLACQWSGDLSKSGELVSRDVSSTTSMRGTVCYVAPEYGGNGALSERSDIYSFGVLVLVILSGRRPIQVTASPMKEFERANLISWARTLSQSGKLLDLMDERLHGDYDREQAILCITLALLCLQRVPVTRPTILEVVKMLSGEILVPPLPLELSPSPPARLTYKLPLRLSKEQNALPEDLKT